jgi:hypothetical protein
MSRINSTRDGPKVPRSAQSGDIVGQRLLKPYGVGFGPRLFLCFAGFSFHGSKHKVHWGGGMSAARRLGVGFSYAAIAALGVLYALFEQHQLDQLTHFINELLPLLFILILAFAVYCATRISVSVLKELSGVSRAAHATLHVGYGMK